MILGRLKRLFGGLVQPMTSRLYFSGIRLFNSGKYEKAAGEFSQIRKSPYKSSAVYSRLADFYYYRAHRNAALLTFYIRNYVKCILHCKHALEIAPNDTVCLNYLAHSYHQVGQYGAAITQLKKLARLAPHRADVKFNLAKLYAKAEKTEEALKILEELISQFESYPDFHLIRGIVFGKKGFSEEAIHCFQKTVDLNPRYAKGRLLLGFEYIRSLDYKKAYETFREGSLASPENTDMLFYCSLAQNIVERISNNVVESSELVEVVPEAPFSFRIPKNLLTDIGFLDNQTVQERFKMLELDISYGEHFTFLDPIYDKPLLNQLVEIFEALILSFPNYADYNYKLGTFYLKLGLSKKAEHQLLKALKINPGYTLAMVDLSMVYEEEARYVEALELLTNVLKSKPDSPQTRIAIGRLLIKVEQYEAAIDHFCAASALDKRYQYHQYLLGQMLADKGMDDGARRCWSDLKDFMPDVPKKLSRLKKSSDY